MTELFREFPQPRFGVRISRPPCQTILDSGRRDDHDLMPQTRTSGICGKQSVGVDIATGKYCCYEHRPAGRP